VPVIITSGQQARRYTELKAYLTNVDAPKLVEPLVKWSHEPARPQDAPQSLSKAILLATAAPTGPVYLSLPLDDWDQDADASALGQLKSRVIDGKPVVTEEALGRLRERLAAARNPVMVAGPDIDTPTGWDGGARLAEKLSLPVLVAPSPARCPFPTRHPNYLGVLPGSIPDVASHFDGHDLVVAFGAPIFMYHEYAEGDYLPAGTELWAVTADPDEAARAPMGRILVGDPAEAVKRLADTIPGAGRPPLTREPLPQADTTGPAFTEEAIMDAVPSACSSATRPGGWWRCSATARCTTRSAGCGPPPSTTSRSSSSSRATASTGR
jgi:benzoylformate decarboxylase